MKLLAELLQDFGVKWLKLKIYDEKQIAIGYFQGLDAEGKPAMNGEITVAVFRPAVDLTGEETVGMPMATVRKFRKKDRKIAHWYYRELKKAYKNGVLQVLPGRKTVREE